MNEIRETLEARVAEWLDNDESEGLDSLEFAKALVDLVLTKLLEAGRPDESWDGDYRPSLEIMSAQVAVTSPGPWHVGTEKDGVMAGRQTAVFGPDRAPMMRRIVTVGQTRQHDTGRAEQNVAFIAHARRDFPALLDAVKAVLALPYRETGEGAISSLFYNEALKDVREALETYLELDDE